MILCVAFYAIASLLIDLVSDYLFKTKISTETATVQSLATEFSPVFARGDAESLHELAVTRARELGSRLFIIDMDGKVQIDTYSERNGTRLSNPEVISVLNGAASAYGFHLGKTNDQLEMRALFDFLRNRQPGEAWVGYFSEALIDGRDRVGLVLYMVKVQDMVDELRVIQDKMVVVLIAAAAAVFAMSLIFTQIITNPLAKLTDGIKRMARGNLSTRVKVSGNDEMARLAETFNQMSQKIENLDTSRNDFVSNASHELKTPLATMKIMLESMLYQDDMDLELRREFLTDINKELDRLSNIVTDLLTLVQTDASEYKPVRSNLLLREIVDDTVHRLEPLAKERGQSLKYTAQAGAPIFADPVKIQQVAYNLIDNAIKYSPRGGKVRVIVRQEGKSAILEVSDNGPGIPKADQPHIFDRFYRVDRARSRATGGNGLGLSIVHQAVLLHDGSVTIHSEEGQGCTFRVELPLAPQ